MKNVELKARVADFSTARGRLKLREFGDGSGELMKIPDSALLSGAYIDLLEQGAGGPAPQA